MAATRSSSAILIDYRQAAKSRLHRAIKVAPRGLQTAGGPNLRPRRRRANIRTKDVSPQIENPENRRGHPNKWVHHRPRQSSSAPPRDQRLTDVQARPTRCAPQFGHGIGFLRLARWSNFQSQLSGVLCNEQSGRRGEWPIRIRL
jgi:hypothetical protein